MSPSDEPSLMGKRDSHRRVAIWTECQRIDMRLTGVPHFRVPTERGIDHREHRRTSTETYRQHELLCSSFAAGPKLGIRCKKEVSAIWEPRSSRGAMLHGSRRAYRRNDNLMLCQAKDCVCPISAWWLQPLATSRKGEFGWASSQEDSRANALRQM
jgi:hypothetical protein